MSYVTGWYLDKRVAVLRVEGELTLDDLPRLSTAIRTCVAEGNAPVHVFVDLQGVTKHPTNLREAMSRLRSDPNPLVGWTILITNNYVLRFLGSMFIQLLKQRVHALGSMEAAVDFLLARDGSLEEYDVEELRALV